MVSLADALFRGPAPDGGLYLPAEPLALDSSTILAGSRSFADTARMCARQWLGGEAPVAVLDATVAEALDFPVPLVPLEDGLFVLELTHGPTLAFKDVGARFMAALMDRLDPEPDRTRVVLVATSGDTGSAVAHAFAGRERFRVVVLYPRDGVSEVQRKLFTTLGGNVTAVAVAGVFDDCQRLVRGAFTHPRARPLGLTAANSINVGRLLPQAFYYGDAVRQGGWRDGCVFSVPSGNLGNLTAGLLAAEAGLPVERLVAALNANDVFHRYLETGVATPVPSRATLSNAMDVGDPSNLERLVALAGGDHVRLRRRVWSATFDDDRTLECMARVYRDTGYLLDPHGAVGVLGAEAYRERAAGVPGADAHRRGRSSAGPVVVLATAHPAKFPDVVERAVGRRPETPGHMARALEGEERIVGLEPREEALMELLESVAGTPGASGAASGNGP